MNASSTPPGNSLLSSSCLAMSMMLPKLNVNRRTM
jgi:hypothetical protein